MARVCGEQRKKSRVSRVEVAPFSVERTLTHSVYAGAFARGFQRDRYLNCRTSAEACVVQELKGSVFTLMPSFPSRKSTSIFPFYQF